MNSIATATALPPTTTSTDSRELFLQAAWGAFTPRAPIWMMRQAGRYLPEYRALKERYDFYTLCSEPELAAEVTLQPVRRYAVDAAVIFTDIMVPALAMGIPVEFTPGPVIEPVRSAEQIAALRVPEQDEVAPTLAAAVRLTCAEASVPVIGHAGAPLTFASYLVSGAKSPDHVAFRTWLRDHPGRAHALLEKAAETSLRSLRMQIDAGAEVVQLFDSWVGLHDMATYAEFGLPYVKHIMDGLAGAGVPRIYFAPAAVHLFGLVADVPAEVIALDWRAGLHNSRFSFGQRALQGNIDPAVLLGDTDSITRAASTCLNDGLGGAHIFNLGGGMLPTTPPENVTHLVETVRAFQRTASSSCDLGGQ